MHPRSHAATVTLALQLDVDAGTFLELLDLLVPRIIGRDDSVTEDDDEDHQDNDRDADDQGDVPELLSRERWGSL